MIIGNDIIHEVTMSVLADHDRFVAGFIAERDARRSTTAPESTRKHQRGGWIRVPRFHRTTSPG